jgi:hypothetical protein
MEATDTRLLSTTSAAAAAAADTRVHGSLLAAACTLLELACGLWQILS